MDTPSISINYAKAPVEHVVKDPGSIFGGLLLGCISDHYADQDPKVLAEGVLFLLLGAFSSVATTYLLSWAGILV